MRSSIVVLALVAVLVGCGGDELGDPATGVPTSAETEAPDVTPVEATAEATVLPVVDPSEVFYGSCAEVRAAGADPIREGDPGYSTDLDRDGDGIACE